MRGMTALILFFSQVFSPFAEDESKSESMQNKQEVIQ